VITAAAAIMICVFGSFVIGDSLLSSRSSARGSPPRPDDVITKVNGEPATSNIQLQELTLTKRPGDTVTIEYTRAGHSTTITVKLGVQP
jgi:S1-C subfamily serine protease